MIAACGHDITDYPWDWPGVWTQGFHEGGVGPKGVWYFSALCFSCIMKIMKQPDCIVQFTSPDKVV